MSLDRSSLSSEENMLIQEKIKQILLLFQNDFKD